MLHIKPVSSEGKSGDGGISPYCLGIDVCHTIDKAECPAVDWCDGDFQSSCWVYDWCDPTDYD